MLNISRLLALAIATPLLLAMPLRAQPVLGANDQPIHDAARMGGRALLLFTLAYCWTAIFSIGLHQFCHHTGGRRGHLAEGQRGREHTDPASEFFRDG